MKTPYDIYKSSPFWKIIDNSLKELQKNQDIEISTNPDYVVGFIVKAIESNKV